MNRQPAWQPIAAFCVLALSVVYVLPNIYPSEPALQIDWTGAEPDGITPDGVASDAAEPDGPAVDAAASDIAEPDAAGITEPDAADLAERVAAALDRAGVAHAGMHVDGGRVHVRLGDPARQWQARDLARHALGDEATVEIGQASSVPAWLRRLGARPMSWGSALRGGMHLLLEADLGAYLRDRVAHRLADLRIALRRAGIGHPVDLTADRAGMRILAQSPAQRTRAIAALEGDIDDLRLAAPDAAEPSVVELRFSARTLRRLERRAMKRSVRTVRRRLEELGVPEPLVRRRGNNRIAVTLPASDAYDLARLKRILVRMANVEFRISPLKDTPQEEREPLDFLRERERMRMRGDGAWVLREAMVTGNDIVNAQLGFNPQTGAPKVDVWFGERGSQRMHRATRRTSSFNRYRGATITQVETRQSEAAAAAGQTEPRPERDIRRYLINYGVIRNTHGAKQRIANMASAEDATELALLLRAGVLPAPLDIIEEGAVSPSLGAENVARAERAAQLGMLGMLALVLLCCGWFGVAANLAVAGTLLALAAGMSALAATLTLPGLIGAALAVMLAVDANMLVCARIQEAGRAGLGGGQAIADGYRRARGAVVDAGLVVLLIAGTLLYLVRTGPLHSFALTAFIGVLASMLFSLWGARALLAACHALRPAMRAPSMRLPQRVRGVIAARFIASRRQAAIVSLGLALAAASALAVRGLPFSPDFAGAVEFELGYQAAADLAGMRERLAGVSLGQATLAHAGAEQDVVIRLDNGDEADVQEAMRALSDGLEEPPTLRRVEFVDLALAKALREHGVTVLSFGLLLAMLYIAARFRRRFLVGIAVAVAYDVLIVLGASALFGWRLDATALAVLAAVIGYSLHSAVAVADRIRACLRAETGSPAELIDTALERLAGRGAATALSVLAPLALVAGLSGESVREPLLALLVGMLSATRSSTRIAPEILLALGIRREDLPASKPPGPEPVDPAPGDPEPAEPEPVDPEALVDAGRGP